MMVNQYKSTHQGMLPEKIILTPQAALALALKEAYGDNFLGVQVVSMPFEENEVAQPGQGTKLGVFMHGNPESIRSCDLR
jgi:hypothetical protein